MKKRLLITSIVMMLVVAVALSTATYAWFTSNATVTASTVSFTAATSTADAIAIAWTGNTNPGTTLAPDANAGTAMQPMVPTLPVVGTTTSTAFEASFTTGTLYSKAGVPTFNTADSYTANPVVWQTNDNNGEAEGATPAASFYIKNLSLAKTVTNIKVTASITDATGDNNVGASNLVRVAIFSKDLGANGATASSGNYLLRGILAKTAGYASTGAVSGEAPQETAITANGIATTAAATGFNICKISGADQSLAADSQVDVVVIVWMDGEALTDSTAGKQANVALTFSAVTAG